MVMKDANNNRNEMLVSFDLFWCVLHFLFLDPIDTFCWLATGWSYLHRSAAVGMNDKTKNAISLFFKNLG